jgi:hypothetical protein
MMKKRSNQHLRIWKKHHQTISKDIYGRRHDIHHIDGDHTNNNIENLIELSIHEHYEIHYWQEDWKACQIIAARLKLSPKQISEFARCAQNSRVEDGTHIFLGGKLQTRVNLRRVANGTHPWAGKNALSKTKKFREERKESIIGDKNPRFDHTVYRFQHKKTKETVEMTQREFVIAYELNHSGVSELVNNKLKSTGGWTIIKVI